MNANTQWVICTPVIDYSVREICCSPYEGHKLGCPNFGKADRCPPKASLFDKVADLSKPVYIIWNEFPFGDHVKRMQAKHPEWSKRQIECCLYWQGTARKQLRLEILKFKKQFPEWTIATCPEAMGINVTETFKQTGLELEWPPLTKTYQIVLAYIYRHGN